MTTALAPINRRFANNLRPARKPRPFGEFVRTIRLPDGPLGPKNGQPGAFWTPETEPTQAQFVAEVDSDEWSIIAIAAPSQRGKTLKAILSPTLHRITECRQGIVYALPSLDLLSKAWDGKIKPAIEGTGFGGWLPARGPGSKGGRPSVLTFRDPATQLVAGRMYFTAMGAGKKESAAAAVTAQVIMVDEADDVTDAGKLKNVCKRIESYGVDGRAFIASTVNDSTGREAADPSDPASAHPILVFIGDGSQHRAHHPCPHCKGYFVPALEHLDIEACAIVCPLCAAIWSESDRRTAINGLIMCGNKDRIEEGRKIRGAYPDRKYSELTTCLDYHMTVIESVCDDMRIAKRKEPTDQSLMRTAMNKLWCLPYVPPAVDGEITNKYLADLSSRSDYDKRSVPHWCTHLCGAVDVQGDRHYWIVVGLGPDDRWAAIDWGFELLVPYRDGKSERPPTPADRRRVLVEIDAKFNAGWQREGSQERLSPLPNLRGIDTGYLTGDIVNWLRGVRGWLAVKGLGEDTIKHPGKHLELPPEAKAFVELRQPDGWPIPLVHVIGDTLRKYAHGCLLRNPYTAASGMIPRGLKANDVLCTHLSGEVWKDATLSKDGKTVPGFWAHPHPRWDLLDCLLYALAVSRLRAGLQSRRDAVASRKYGRIGSVGVKK